MSEPTFFSFHYKRDASRAWVVRNSWVAKGDDVSGFWDGGLREKVKRNDPDVIRKRIRRGLNGTTVTAVLIGKETSKRHWVRYEIEESYYSGNALLGIYIGNIKGLDGKTDRRGANPFLHVKVDTEESWFEESRRVVIGHEYDIPLYDWVEDDGFNNLDEWIADAYWNCPWS